MNYFIKFHPFPTNINITKIVIIVVTYLLLYSHSPANCFAQIHSPPSDTTGSSLFEGKTRLGSTPPTCHNKCNQCHPCQSVQVPSMPSHQRFQLSRHQVDSMDYYEPSPTYKPLGWKCRCGNHFYNP